MKYEIGDIIISKKPHACGGREWIVVRIGADVKIKCVKCNRFIFVSPDQADKMCKQYIDEELNG